MFPENTFCFPCYTTQKEMHSLKTHSPKQYYQYMTGWLLGITISSWGGKSSTKSCSTLTLGLEGMTILTKHFVRPSQMPQVYVLEKFHAGHGLGHASVGKHSIKSFGVVKFSVCSELKCSRLSTQSKLFRSVGWIIILVDLSR